MSGLDELSGAISSVAERVGSSVVSVGRGGRGSGVVVADGQLLTNAHNLRGGEVTITFADGRSVRGEVRGVDPDGDLAVVAVDTAGAKALDWGAPESGSIGTPFRSVGAEVSSVCGCLAAASAIPRPSRLVRGDHTNDRSAAWRTEAISSTTVVSHSSRNVTSCSTRARLMRLARRL